MDNDDDYGCRRRRSMMNATSKQNSVMYKGNSVPIIYLDDDDDPHHLKPDKDYKLYLDQLRDDISSGSFRYEESETRKFDILSGDFKRSSKVGNENQVVIITQETEHRNRVSEQRKMKNLELKAQIERDNRVAERRKRKIAELEGARRDNKVRRKMSGIKVENLSDVTLVSHQEDGKVGEFSELKVETLRETSLVSDQEDTEVEILSDVKLVSDQEDTELETLSDVKLVSDQEDDKVGEFSELKVETLRDASLVSDQDTEAEILSDVTLVSDQDYVQQDNNVGKFVEVEVEILRDVPSVRTGEDNISERRKSKTAETKAGETSRDVSVELDRVREHEAVDETSSTVLESPRNKGASVERRKKNVGIVDKDYMSYLSWLVDSLKDSATTKQMENLQNDQSAHLVLPVSDTLKESTLVPEKDLFVKVKEELVDFESWSDDSDIIAVSDSPFLDGEGTTFVASKSAVDLDKESEEDGNSRLYKEKLMDILKKPYNERELRRLSKEVSMKRSMTRYRQFRKGREKSYESDKLGQSYLERYSDFDEEYNKPVYRVDKAKALTLLRGFFFYLENVSHDGAFKPWDKNKQCLQA